MQLCRGSSSEFSQDSRRQLPILHLGIHPLREPVNRSLFLSSPLGPSVGRTSGQYPGRSATTAMYTLARRKLASHSALFHHQRSLAATSGVGKISARELKYLRPASRQYSSLLLSGSRARPRGLRPAQALFRQIHARAISYSSIPRFVARAFRVPIAGATVGAGGLTYANYKYEGTLSPALSRSTV